MTSDPITVICENSGTGAQSRPGHPVERDRRHAPRRGEPPPAGRLRQQPPQGAGLQDMHARIGALHRHHLLRRIQGLPADRVVHPPEGRARPLAPGTAPHPPLAGAERILLRDRGNRTAGRCGDRDPDAPHAGHRRGRLPHRAPQDAHLGGAAPLRRARLRRQDRPARHAPPALQQALHAGRHHRLLLRLFGPSTRYTPLFDLERYFNGFYIALPCAPPPTASTATPIRRRCSTSSTTTNGGSRSWG